MTEPLDNSKLIRITLGLILFCTILGMMYIGKDFLIPLVWGFFIYLASLGFLQRLHRRIHLPFGLLSAIHLLVLFVAVGSVMYFFIYEIRMILINIPALDEKLMKVQEWASQLLVQLGQDPKAYLDLSPSKESMKPVATTLLSFVGSIGNTLGNLSLMLVYSFLFLLYEDLLPRFLAARIKDENKVKEAEKMTKNIVIIASDYLSGTMIMTVVMGIMLYFAFLVLGIQYTLFFAVFIAVFNLIPYLGNLIAMIVLIGFTLLTKEGWLYSVGALAIVIVVNAIQENVLRPLIVGEKLHLNALMVFVSVVLGGFIWGISGMVLFIPIAGMLKIIFEHNQTTRPHALLFGEPSVEINKNNEEAGKEP